MGRCLLGAHLGEEQVHLVGHAGAAVLDLGLHSAEGAQTHVSVVFAHLLNYILNGFNRSLQMAAQVFVLVSMHAILVDILDKFQVVLLIHISIALVDSQSLDVLDLVTVEVNLLVLRHLPNPLLVLYKTFLNDPIYHFTASIVELLLREGVFKFVLH